MRDRLASIVAILLLLGLIASSYWYSIKSQQEAVTRFSDLNAPDFIAKDVTITQFDLFGRAKQKVFATNVDHYADGHADVTDPEYLSLETGKAQISARSDTAHMEAGGEVIHFKGNVVITQSAFGKAPTSKLETSAMDAWPDTEKYTSDEPVKLTRGRDVSTGIGMDFDNVDRTFRLRSKVTTVLQPRTAQKD